MRYGDRFGVCAHPDEPDYRNRLPELIDWCSQMGIRWVRANGTNLGPLIAAGLQVQAIVHTVAEAKKVLALGPAAVELNNEPPTAAACAAVAKVNDDIVDALDDQLPIVHTALAGNVTKKLAPALGATRGAHYGAVHGYRGNRAQKLWDGFVADLAASTAITAPHLPWMATETGTHAYTGVEPNGKPASHRPTPPDVWAAQIIPDAVGWFRNGATRIFYYEAFDQPVLGNTFEAHFGLAGTPAAAVLQAHLAAFGDYDDLAVLDMAPKLDLARQAGVLVDQAAALLG